jgi:hypothetical protein
MIPFDKYNLPQIEPYKIDISGENDPIRFFEGKLITQDPAGKKHGNELNRQLDIIMEYFINEVETNKRKPNDFLIITPFTTNNPLVDLLQGRINTYWKDRIGKGNDDYFRYAIFHKSEEGSSIDLDESAESTRIVSIHASKGDGRNVVFMIGFSESALRRFSGRKESLIYDSLFHVAITRMKQKLYIQYQNNGDSIVRKLNEYMNREMDDTQLKPNIHIYHSIKYSDIISRGLTSSFNELRDKFINHATMKPLEEDTSDKRIIDMGNHTIRYSSLLISVLIHIINKEGDQSEEIKRQIKAILHAVADSVITLTHVWNKYNIIVSGKELALMKISKEGRDYLRYHDIIYDNMQYVIAKLKKGLKENVLPAFCPFECVILNHMIGITQNGSYASITIGDIYNIVDVYSKSYDVGTSGHESCLCEKSFCDKKDCAVSNASIDVMRGYLHSHFEKVKYIEQVMGVFHEKYPRLNWLYNHVVKYNGQNDNYKVWRQFTLVGYDNDTVVVAYIKPQFNALNFNEVLINSIYDAYILNNIAQYEEECGIKKVRANYTRFHGKKFVSCVFTLDRKEPYYITWWDGPTNLIEANSDMLKQLMYTHMDDYYSYENSSIEYFYKYWRTNCPTEHSAPKKFIDLLLDEYNKMKDKNNEAKKHLPSYIDDFFRGIKGRLEFCSDKNQRKDILAQYDESAFFITNLNNTMSQSVKRFLNIEANDSDDESD